MAVTLSMKKTLSESRGFTLIEIIAVIVLTAVLSVILFQIAANNTTRAYQPLARLDRSLALKEVMEQITAEYQSLLETASMPTSELQNKIQDWQDNALIPNDIQINSYCFTFNQAAGANWQEPAAHSSICQSYDQTLKVTVSWENQSLTALFAPYRVDE